MLLLFLILFSKNAFLPLEFLNFFSFFISFLASLRSLSLTPALTLFSQSLLIHKIHRRDAVDQGVFSTELLLSYVYCLLHQHRIRNPKRYTKEYYQYEYAHCIELAVLDSMEPAYS